LRGNGRMTHELHVRVLNQLSGHTSRSSGTWPSSVRGPCPRLLDRFYQLGHS
jgi:hypothetical protein